MSELVYPDDLRYTTEHEWVRSSIGSEPSGAGVVRIGVTSYAQDALGDIVFVSLPEIGSELTEGQPCGEIESTKSVSDVYAPLSGKVVAVNAALEGTPDLVNSDPYGQGWLFDLAIDDMADLDGLLDSKSYQAELD